MITDAKVVKSVNSNAPKKGWKIEWVDGKFDNIFDEGWLPLLDESIRTNRLVSFDKEKNEAGYWNIKRLELATLPDPGEQPRDNTKRDVAPQEIGMWWKEVGMNFRSGLFDKTTGDGKLLYKAYVAQMMSVLPITIKNKEDN